MIVRVAVLAAGAVLAYGGFSIVRNETSSSTASAPQLVAEVSGYMKGYETVTWPFVSGVSGYALIRDGVRVATAGAGATTTRFYLQNPGTHTLTVTALFATPTTTTATTAPTTTAPVTTTAPTTTAPAPAGTFKSFGALRLGTDYSKGTGYDRYGLVVGTISDADLVAALPASVHRLVYMSAVDLATFFTGVDHAEALANGWTLLPETSANFYLLDPGNAGYQQAFIKEVGAFLRLHHLDGYYVDDVAVDPRQLTACNCWPAKYANGVGWIDALAQFIQVTGDALKAQGFYVGANAIAYFPGNVLDPWPGTDSDSGTSDQKWASILAPHLSFYMMENFEITNGKRRTDQTSTYPIGWKGVLEVENVVHNAGADFWGSQTATSGTDTAILYSYGSQLLNHIQGRGGTMVNCACDPFNAVWARDPGAPLEPKTLVGQVWRRRFQNFTVYVNPTLSSQAADGLTLSPASAVFKP